MVGVTPLDTGSNSTTSGAAPIPSQNVPAHNSPVQNAASQSTTPNAGQATSKNAKGAQADQGATLAGNAFIEFQHVHKKFDSADVLTDINLKINKGEVFGIIGVSGAGKTTLLRSLIGYYKIDSGKIFFEGDEVEKNLAKIRKRVGFSTQDNCMYYELSVQENMQYFADLYGLPQADANKRIVELLNLVELYPARGKMVKDMSGGMKRRLDVAIALLHKPPILILDEPTAGLDPVLRNHMWNLIGKISSSGTTVVISSHLLSEIENVCTRIAIIHNGKILEIGTPESMKETYSRDEEIHIQTLPGNYDQIASQIKATGLNITYTHNEGHKLVIFTPDAETVLRKLLDIIDSLGERFLDVDVDRPSLNEVFESVTRKGVVVHTSETFTSDQDYQKQLEQYIHNSLAHGFAEDQIRAQLHEQRWADDMIQKAFAAVKEKMKTENTIPVIGGGAIPPQ